MVGHYKTDCIDYCQNNRGFILMEVTIRMRRNANSLYGRQIYKITNWMIPLFPRKQRLDMGYLQWVENLPGGCHGEYTYRREAIAIN
jgi:hypothetical protein